MMKKIGAILGAALFLSGCVSDSAMQVSPGFEEISVQRMRFAAEAVCLNNRTRRSQERAARALEFPIRQREGDATVYANLNTLTFLRIGPAPSQATTTPSGQRVIFSGNGCSVGSPAVGIRRANSIIGEILAPRLVGGSSSVAAPVGGGENESGGVGLFFEDLSVTLPLAQTTLSNPETGRREAFDHPVILIMHR